MEVKIVGVPAEEACAKSPNPSSTLRDSATQIIRDITTHTAFLGLDEHPIVAIEMQTGRIIETNAKGSEFLGIPEKESQSHSVEALFEAAAWNRLKETLISDDSAGLQPKIFKTRIHRQGKGTELAKIHAKGCVLAGQPCGLLFFNPNPIREGGRAKQREVEERYRALFNHSRELIYVCDLAGNFLDGNARALSLFGYNREELSQVSLGTLLAEDDLGSAMRHFSRILENGYDADPHEYRIKTKEGRLLWVEANGVRIDRDDKPHSVMGIARDITARKRAEEALHETEEQLRLTQRMDAIGKLAGGIAHDFNNLLGAITGYCDVLLHELSPGDPLKSDVEEINSAANRAGDLTRQLLAFSRKQVLRPSVLNLNESVRTMDRMLQRLIGEDVELISILDEQLGHVKADPSQIEQVIMNLVLNARDAMPTGGKLIIETQNVSLDVQYASRHVSTLPGEYAMLAFTDTGCGMEEHIHGQIFEPFFTTKQKGKGTGLGLSTVYGIVKQSNGNIWVYSTPDVGTTFKVYLPRVDENPSSKAMAKPQDGELRGSETILIVEDDDLLRSLILRMTRLYGYEPLEARHGGEAIVICEKYKGDIDLLLTDVVMPHLSGNELAKRVHAIRPSAKVLFMSGYTDNAIVEHGLLGEKVNFIQKPFHAEGLVMKIRKVLDGKKS